MVLNTCVSRVYRGAHSVPDLLGGALISFLSLALYLPIARDFDTWVISGSQAFYFFPVFAIGCLLLHPPRKEYSDTYGDAAAMFGTGSGTIMGSYLAVQYSIATCPFPLLLESNANRIHALSASRFQFGIVRLIVGVALLMLIKAVSKKLLTKFLLRVLPASTIPPTQRFVVVVPCKFMSYTCLGLACAALVPAVQNLILPWSMFA
jgi:hypothetical protein